MKKKARGLFVDEKEKNQLYALIGIIGSLASIISLAVSLDGWWKLSGIVVVAVLVVGMIGIRKQTGKKETSFYLNNTYVKVSIGDIFKPNLDEISVIPFNEYYDTIVDDLIVAKNTLHGMYINQLWDGQIDELDRIIKNDIVLSKNKLGLSKSRKRGNKQKYKLGSTIRINNFILTAMTHFDMNNKAVLDYSEYIEFLFSFWNNLDEIYANHTINIPVFGAGITRIQGKKPSIQQLIETILWSLSMSSFQGKRVNIVVYFDNSNDVDFYHLEPKVY